MINKKQALAGSIVAGVCIMYANSEYNIKDSKIVKIIEENLEIFKNIIEEIATFSLELLEKLVVLVKKLMLEVAFKLKMIINKI